MKRALFWPLLVAACLASAHAAEPVVLTMTPAETQSFAQVWCQTPGHCYGYVNPTGSMRPLIEDNSVIFYETAPENLEKRDVAVYVHADGREIIHRAVDVRHDGWAYFSGDHNRRSDGWVSPKQITRRVVFIVKPI